MLIWYVSLLYFQFSGEWGPYCSTVQLFKPEVLVGFQSSGQKRHIIDPCYCNTCNLLTIFSVLPFSSLFVIFIQEDFYAIIDWAWKVDPLCCISMHGITERYLSGQKTDAASFVHKLLDDLRSKIVSQFNKVWHYSWIQLFKEPLYVPYYDSVKRLVWYVQNQKANRWSANSHQIVFSI
jgi:hypothetical protein